MTVHRRHLRSLRYAAPMLCALMLVLSACDRHSESTGKPASATSSPTQPAAATPEHFVNPDANPMPKVLAHPVAFPVVPQAPKPTSSLPKSVSCVTAECHAKMNSSPQIHAPVAARACDICHDADTGRHQFPLKRDPIATCTFCHAVSGTMTHQHKALEKGCTACHRPHESNAKFLLKADNVERVCATCHEVPLKKFAHGPFAKGECTICHQPHQAENAKLLRGGDEPQHCFTCHANIKESMAKAIKPHEPATQKCSTCHGPHATDYAFQLKAPLDETCLKCHEKVKQQIATASLSHAAVLTENRCANCHDAHGSTEPKLLAQRMDKVCLKCHDKPQKAQDGHTIPDMRPEIAGSKFLHGPVSKGDCSACHSAHGGGDHALLAKTFPKTFYISFDIRSYDLCFSCHDKNLVLTAKTEGLTGFRNGQQNLHFLHVNRDDKGRTCKTCHAIHGSNQPNHVAAEVPFEGSKWAMPMNFEKTPTGGSCTPGCHKIRTYDRVRPTTQPASGGVP